MKLLSALAESAFGNINNYIPTANDDDPLENVPTDDLKVQRAAEALGTITFFLKIREIPKFWEIIKFWEIWGNLGNIVKNGPGRFSGAPRCA
jgi:hypothetical protein